MTKPGTKIQSTELQLQNDTESQNTGTIRRITPTRPFNNGNAFFNLLARNNTMANIEAAHEGNIRRKMC